MHSGAYCWMTSLRNLLYIVSYRSFARARSEVTGGGERSGDQRSFGKCTKSNLLSSTSMDDQSRMMHPVSGQVGVMPQPYGIQPVDPSHGAPATPDQETRRQDIGEILQQIMNITDQSLDEAQARRLVT
ncbi:Putative transcription factor pbx [Gryllus bimaculatus]|nr:Putative transcription factor pbx [Gryllus bimaculatus]